MYGLMPPTLYVCVRFQGSVTHGLWKLVPSVLVHATAYEPAVAGTVGGQSFRAVTFDVIDDACHVSGSAASNLSPMMP